MLLESDTEQARVSAQPHDIAQIVDTRRSALEDLTVYLDHVGHGVGEEPIVVGEIQHTHLRNHIVSAEAYLNLLIIEDDERLLIGKVW